MTHSVEKPASKPTGCRQCGGSISPSARAGRVGRCATCGYVAALLPPPADDTLAPTLRDPPAIAPRGLVRDKYRLIRKLGEGAHGVAYLAEHQYLSHPCVVKVLAQRSGPRDDNANARLRAEARAGYRVHDPNVVRVLDCDVIKGAWYFVMEYVEGINLGQVIAAEERMPWQQAVAVATDVTRGLAAIHRHDLVHRDIKPANLLLATNGRARVADLGVVGLSQERSDPRLPVPPALVGTLGYTAPEVFQPNEAVGPQADFYALGASLYHLITGRLPHDATRVFQYLIDMQCHPAQWPADAPGDVPAWLVAAILRLLATEPAQRPGSAQEVLQDLHAADPAVALRTSSMVEPLAPRGIGVLPLKNAAPAGDDDWLGYAVSNYIARSLAQMPQVYVVDPDALLATAQRIDQERVDAPGDSLLEAGRIMGAGTVITGEFRRTGADIEIAATARRLGDDEVAGQAAVHGRLTDLGRLERNLLQRMLRELGLGGAKLDEPTPIDLEARELFVRGKQAYLRGDYEDAIGAAQAAIERAGDYAEAIGFVGVCFARLGDYEAAEAHHRRQERLGRSWGEARWQIEARANLGVMHYFRGDYESAEEHYAAAAEMASALDLAAQRAQIHNNLGFVLFRRERLPEAEQAFTAAIETHQAFGGLSSLVGPYSGLGNVLTEQGRYAEARKYYRRALSLATDIGDRTSVGTSYMHLGHCNAREGRFAEAKHEFTMALNALEETRFWNGLARAYEHVAAMNLQLGDVDEALRCADKRIDLARLHSNVRMEAAAWNQKAAALERAGRAADAAACREQARCAGRDAHRDSRSNSHQTTAKT
jgi:serine/threonine protein kinase/Tfp pilus assembly protein PilF